MDDPALMRAIAESPSGLEWLVAEHLLPKIHESFDDLRTCARDAAAVIVGSLSYAAPAAAEACGVPWYLTLLSPTFAAKRHEAPPGLRAVRSPRLALGLFSSVLGNVESGWPAGTMLTGFPFYDDPPADVAAPLDAFLKNGDAPVVFTLGTAAVFDPRSFFDESLAAARWLGRRALLLTGRTQLRGDRSSDVLAIPYAPYSIVFPRAAAIVHHGGIGTVGQALRAGRPMLVVPRFLDQPNNALRVRRLGVGRVMHASAYTAKHAAAELSQLLENPRYGARAREVGAIVRLERGTATACDALEHELAAA